MDLTMQCNTRLGQDSECKHTTRSTSAHTSPTLHPTLPQLSLSLPGWRMKPRRLPRWRLPRLSVYFQARGPVLRQAGRQSVRRCGEGRGVDACVREALSHIPPAAGSKPGLRRGVRLFLTTSQVPALIWELFISCQKTAFPCNCRRRRGLQGNWEKEGREKSLASMQVQGLVQQALGLNHKALACLGCNQSQPQ